MWSLRVFIDLKLQAALRLGGDSTSNRNEYTVWQTCQLCAGFPKNSVILNPLNT